MKHKLLCVILWITTISWLFFCFYLSWQTGEETVGFSSRIAQWLFDFLRNWHCEVELKSLHTNLRLFAHFGVFFVTGLLTTCTLTVTFPRERNGLVICVAATSCTLIAIFTEVGKLRIPGRHLTWSEAGLNVIGAACGIAVVSGVMILKNRLLMKR